MKNNRMSLLLLTTVIILGIGAINADAAWVTITLDNPGAETGDLTGWNNSGQSFSSVLDPSGAFQGSYFFSSNFGSPYDFVYSSISTDVDLTPFLGNLLDADILVANRYDQKFITGFDTQSGNSYQYSWTAFLQTNLWSYSAHQLGLGGTITPSQEWSLYGFNLKQHWKWDEVNENLTMLNVMLKYMLNPTDPNAPAARDIEEWYNWEDGIPDFNGFDSVTVKLEVVPIPAAVWLFGSGIIGLVALRRRKG